MPTTYGYRHLTRLQQCSRHSHSTSTSSIRAIPVLPNATLPTFRKEAFEAAIPALLPRQHFLSLPAREKWFQQISETQTSISLNKSYLSQYGDAPVPLELTSNGAFTQIEQPLSFFLEYVCLHSSFPPPSMPDPTPNHHQSDHLKPHSISVPSPSISLRPPSRPPRRRPNPRARAPRRQRRRLQHQYLARAGTDLHASAPRSKPESIRAAGGQQARAIVCAGPRDCDLSPRAAGCRGAGERVDERCGDDAGGGAESARGCGVGRRRRRRRGRSAGEVLGERGLGV